MNLLGFAIVHSLIDGFLQDHAWAVPAVPAGMCNSDIHPCCHFTCIIRNRNVDQRSTLNFKTTVLQLRNCQIVFKGGYTIYNKSFSYFSENVAQSQAVSLSLASPTFWPMIALFWLFHSTILMGMMWYLSVALILISWLLMMLDINSSSYSWISFLHKEMSIWIFDALITCLLFYIIKW